MYCAFVCLRCVFGVWLLSVMKLVGLEVGPFTDSTVWRDSLFGLSLLGGV